MMSIYEVVQSDILLFSRSKFLGEIRFKLNRFTGVCNTEHESQTMKVKLCLTKQ